MISAVIIAKNEEKIIENALESLKFCDEIIVVDNASEDKTAQIAKSFGAKVIRKESDNFSQLRNTGQENSAGDYLLYIDADEIVDETLSKSILFEIKSNSSTSAYRLKRKNFYLGKYEWPYEEEIIRLFKKSKLLKWTGKIHESPLVDGNIANLDGYILHFTHRDLSQMLKKTTEWSDIESEIRLKAKHPKMTWWRFPRVMITTFVKYYLIQKGYKLGTAGLIESIYQTYSMFITYAKLWEMQNKK